MRRQDILDRVVKAQAEFNYEKVVDEGDYKVYRCKKPGTSTYAFEILVGCYGIYLNGDINCLVWDVAKDINFLAGDDVDYYIHSKLAAPFREQREVDPEELDEWLTSEMVRWLDQNPDSLDGELLEKDPRSAEGNAPWTLRDSSPLPTLSEVADFFVAHGLDGVMIDCDVWQLYEEIHESDDIEHIFHEGYKYDPDFPVDNNITRPKWSVMFCLYMACYAARQIKEKGLA